MALLLARHDVERLLDADALLAALAEGFRAISADPRVDAPARSALSAGDKGSLLTMPGFVPELQFGTKLVSIFPGNAAAGLPSHQGLIVLMDPATGAVSALLDAEHVTAMRTAGAATLAAKLLARPESRVMTILGAGVQGRAHLELMSRHFELETVFVASRSRASAEAFAARDDRVVVADSIEAAVRASDIICLCSQSAEPLVLADWVQPGQHISSVGYAPPGGELDPAIAAAHTLFVEARIAFAPPPAGCAELRGIDPGRGTELGELLLGLRPGRRAAAEVTVYKAMGHAIEDLVVANLVHRAAIERSAGRVVDL
ncbi:ornithine cyclodeaminase family protein [Sphingomonas sp.]|uniref:ornithine cyclodeaminase family protein n=1 Tax=Sphingomonas sp. TaxID=28214 RepID=UPI001B284BED|nr:ornithine cyclodeaminase family protein [Sphingomonas sp.]MBO9714596.1 ornithine cyclodeaminase family protein [Sphingomonas sp.]